MGRPVYPASWVWPLGRGNRLDLRLRALSSLTFGIGAALAELAGKDVAERLAVKPAYDVGLRVGARYARQFEIQGKNAISSAAPAVVALESFESRYDVTADAASAFALEVRSCPLRDRAAEAGPEAARACCGACGEYMKGLVHAVNPQAEARMPRRMGLGDPSCTLEVQVKARQPGPRSFLLPSQVEFLPSATRKEMLVDALLGMLTEATRRAPPALDPATTARVLNLAAYPAGLRDGRQARDAFRITGRDLRSAGLTANAVNEVEGLEHEVVRDDAEEYVWRAHACPFVALREVAKNGGGAEGFICVACRNYNEGLLHSATEEVTLEIDARMAAGDPHCEFRAERAPARRRVRRPQRGVVDLGLSRVALLHADSTYYYVWKLLGETLQHVGRRAAADLVRDGVRAKTVAKDEGGFRDALEALADAGYGALRVESLDLGAPRAVVHVEGSFEAQAALRHGEKGGPVCHLTAGLLAGALEEITGLRGLLVTERACVANGAPRCVFALEPAA